MFVSDPALKTEYVQLDELLREFEDGTAELYEVPFDLHEKIMARVDKSVFDERRKSKTGWLTGWRLGLVGGVAAFAIIGSLLSIKNGGGTLGTSGFTSEPPEEPGVTVGLSQGKLLVRHEAWQSTVLVIDDQTGALVKRFDLKGNDLKSPQDNSRDHAVLLRIESTSGSKTVTVVVALPGTEPNTELKGSGTLKDLAKVVADTYRLPVRLNVQNPDLHVAWTLDPENPVRAQGADPTGTDARFHVERRDQILYLTD